MTDMPTIERGREPKVYSGSRGSDANTVTVRRGGSTSFRPLALRLISSITGQPASSGLRRKAYNTVPALGSGVAGAPVSPIQH